METFVVRPVHNSDLPQLMGLDHSSVTDHVWQLEVRRDAHGLQVTAAFREVRLPRPVPLEYPNDPFTLADEWKRKAMVWAAIAGTEPIGYLALEETHAGTSWITDLVVSPKWRRKGVATSLLETLHKWCAERGDRRTFMQMQSKNFPAIMLAQKYGYEFCGYNDRYYLNQDVALVFVRVV